MPPRMARPPGGRWREARQARYRWGRRAEWIAALALMLRGYRILEDLNVRSSITYLAKVVLPADEG